MAALALVFAGCDGGSGSVNEPPVDVPTTPAQLLIQLTGVPANGATEQALRTAGFGARLRGPAGLDTVLLQSGTVFVRTNGRVTITAQRAEYDSVRYTASPDSQSIDVALASTRVASLTYSALTGGLDLRAFGGPPDTTRLSAQLRHPDGRVDMLTLPARIAFLATGTYVITPLPRIVDGVLYAPSKATDTVVVTAGPISGAITIPFNTQRATLRLLVAGVPAADRLGFVTLEGLDRTVRTIPITADTLVFSELPAGTFIVKPQTFHTERARYAPQQSADTIVVAAGGTITRTLAYDRLTASLSIAISGVPASVHADVTVTGPGGFTRVLPQGATLTELVPGPYTIRVSPISTSTHTYAPLTAAHIVTIDFGVPAQHEVTYTLATGALAVHIAGLPDTVTANVVVSAADGSSVPGFPWTLTASAMRTNLSPGTYVVRATARLAGGSLFVPEPAQRTVIVRTSLEATTAHVSYNEVIGPTLDFAIDGAYLTQAAQLPSGTVPLVASRAALMRVFARATQGNNDTLAIRVRLYQGGALYRTLRVPSPTPSTPLDIDEAVLERSWNATIDAGDVREGMRFVVDFSDSADMVDANPANNRWPQSGTQPVDVRTVPLFSLTLVPIHHPIDGLTGNVTAANANTLFSVARTILPLETTFVAVRSPFTTAAPTLQAGDANSGWITILSEINALRIAESGSGSHYAGVVGTPYANGIAGLASIGGKYLLSWDKPGSAQRVLAHELGHNFGRFHSPGCGAGFIDPRYPYGSGIGSWGWTGSSLLNPLSTNDIMGYCNVQWISDYTWTGILNYRAINGFGAENALRRVVAPVPDSVLLLWGHITNGEAQLEPAFRIVASPAPPPVGRGRYVIDVLDARDRVLSTTRFDGDQIDHRDDVRTFAFSVPVRSWTSPAAAIRVREGTRVLTERRVADAPRAPAAVTRVRANDGRSMVISPDATVVRRGTAALSISWNRSEWPAVMVRDVSTGAILMFARRSDQVAQVSGRPQLDLVFSDGVRSVTRRVVVP